MMRQQQMEEERLQEQQNRQFTKGGVQIIREMDDDEQ